MRCLSPVEYSILADEVEGQLDPEVHVEEWQATKQLVTRGLLVEFDRGDHWHYEATQLGQLALRLHRILETIQTP